jgi:hypothetical protein
MVAQRRIFLEHLHTRLPDALGSKQVDTETEEISKPRNLTGSDRNMSYGNLKTTSSQSVSLSFTQQLLHLHGCFEGCIILNNYSNN